MPERNPFEETSTAGRRPGYSQPDTRFGGNLERANTRTADPPRWASDRRDTSSQSFPSDRNVGGKGPLPVLENLGSSNLEKMMSMYDPKGLAYNFFNMLDNTDLIDDKYSPYVRTTDFDDEIGDKLVYQNAEMGEPGAVITNQEEINAARARGDTYIPPAIWGKPTLNKLGSYLLETATTGTYDDQGRFTPTYDFDTSTSDMFTGIPTTLTEENIPAIEFALDELRADIYGGSPGGPGGWSSGSGGGYDDLAALYGAGIGPGPKQRGEGEFIPGQTPLQDYMVAVNRENPYTNLAMARYGGIMNLVK